MIVLILSRNSEASQTRNWFGWISCVISTVSN